MCCRRGTVRPSKKMFPGTKLTVPHPSWQNMDASDASFMTRQRLNTIRLLLRHPKVTLFTLNTPQSSTNGVIPLGMAAWLNMEDAVRLLLEDSCDTVSVDGMDTHGATALMCKTRFFLPVDCFIIDMGSIRCCSRWWAQRCATSSKSLTVKPA